jgi:Divergent InlB B-repeat domain
VLGGFLPAETATAPTADRDILVRVLTGQGTVRSSPAGIDCPPTCTSRFPTTQDVMLTATPAAGQRFRTWSSGFGCEAETTCRLPASSTAQSIDARFVPAGTLILVPNGRGSIAVSPAGHNLATDKPLDRCDEARADDDGGACRLAYVPGTQVAVAALPDAGSQFAGFSDFRCPLPSCRLEVAAGEQSLAASFSPLLLRLRVGGRGRIVSEPAGIDCRGEGNAGCSAAFPFRTPVTLSATGEDGQPVEWIFGCAPEGGNVRATRCATEVNADPTWVVLRFGDANPPGIPSRVTVELTVSTSGSGRVRGQKIDCGGRCEAAYSFGDRERLQAEPEADSRFQSWEGGCGTTSQCEFPVGPITAVRALFAPLRLEARLVRVMVARRRVHVRVSVGRSATLTLRLETRKGRRLASAARSLRGGQTTATLAAPRRLPPGRYRLVVVLRAGQEQARFARLVRIGR